MLQKTAKIAAMLENLEGSVRRGGPDGKIRTAGACGISQSDSRI